MEFEEHEEEEEEEEIDFTPAPPQEEVAAPVPISAKKPPGIRYRECMKNQAVGIGGHAVDGCGEFMPAGPEGSLDALKCAACNCHRNFHRKEISGSGNHQGGPFSHQFHHPHHHQQSVLYQFYPYNRNPSGYLQQRPLALPPVSVAGPAVVHEQEDMSNRTPTGGSGGTGSGRKRFRTKFTQEQKDRMLELAEQLGWRLQKQDEPAVQQFCATTGIKRQVLKVWMHNNKHTLGKKP